MSGQKLCIECGAAFRGRIDKKFCCAACRSQHYNRVNRSDANYIRSINSILKKNRKILKELNKNGSKKIHREVMAEKGFNFSYFTNEYVTQKGKRYRFCYEEGYVFADKNHFTLVKKKPYVD